MERRRTRQIIFEQREVIEYHRRGFKRSEHSWSLTSIFAALPFILIYSITPLEMCSRLHSKRKLNQAAAGYRFCRTAQTVSPFIAVLWLPDLSNLRPRGSSQSHVDLEGRQKGSRE